ncbi:3-deoxy-manno-octulosonate cytidylyltransferase [Poriferisphaera sp. WC338]|uniref:3-deoxy-manno-octulosonate cytidylyltransferase n=1 Tax=Poriferisphaera sp. WC338 TaxID=3425129 RepID=UPI003D814276
MPPQAIAVIPARYDSKRFPGKPLADKTGKPLIQHVVEQVQKANRVGRIIVATDDERIANAVRNFGGDVIMTRNDHPNGTSRIAEVVEKLIEENGGPLPTDTIIANVQGDEPEIEPTVIDELIDGLANDPVAPMATLASDFAENEDPANPNIVKLIVNQKGHAMYFSRSMIPYARVGKDAVTPLKHPGLYAYRPDFLLEYVTLEATPCEKSERLEQLRALEHGYPIAVIKTVVKHHGIDTPGQYEDFVRRMT